MFLKLIRMKLMSDKLKSIVYLGILSLIWGTSFILIKKGLLAYPPDQVGELRVFIASLFFLPYIIKNYRKVNFSVYKYVFLFGLFEIGLPPYLYAFAQTVVSSSEAGILNSLVPLFTLLFGFFLFKVPTNFYKVSGVLLGLIGAILLIFFKSGDFSSVNFSNSLGLLIVLATLMYGFASNIIKEYLQNESGLMITGVAFVSMAIPSLIYLLFTDFLTVTVTNEEALNSLGALVILAFMSSAVAMVIFAKLIQISNALFASFVTYLIPFVSILWGIFDGEYISPMSIIALVMILGGIYLANLDYYRRKALNHD